MSNVERQKVIDFCFFRVFIFQGGLLSATPLKMTQDFENANFDFYRKSVSACRDRS